MSVPISIDSDQEQGERASTDAPLIRIVSDIATSLACEASLEELLRRFLHTLVHVSGAEAASVRLLSADGEHLRLVGAVGFPEEVVDAEKYVAVACGICGEAVTTNQVTSSTSMRRCVERSALRYFGDRVGRIVAVPLRSQGRVLGVFNLFLSSGADLPEALTELFSSISEQLGMALENARLTRENMRVTLMNERQMLANEIHDSVVQTLAYCKMRMALLDDALTRDDAERTRGYLSDVRGAIDSAYADLRTLIRNFRSPMDPRGLLPALRSLSEGLQERCGVEGSFRNLVPEIHLTPDQEVQVFHIVQEALTNVARHSGATRVTVSIDFDAEAYRIGVRDNGQGLPPERHHGRDEEGRQDDEHFGLAIMRERARRIGGTLRYRDTAGKGTWLELIVPVRPSGRRGGEE